MRIVIMRSNPVLPDPRVEKEANALLGFGYIVKILAWNRAPKNGNKNYELKVEKGELPIRWFNIKATFGGGIKNLYSLLIFQLCLVGWLIKHRKEYDIIHACDFDTVIPAWICSRLFRKKYVYDIFDYYIDAFHVPKIIKGLVEKIDIYMINTADTVIVANESRQDQISKSCPKKLVIIHNTPESSNLVVNNESESIIEPSDKPKFAYVGILGGNRLLKEILEIFKEHPEWELHIGGFGPYEEYIKEISSEYKNIKFYGRIPYNKVIQIEQQCDVLFAVYNPAIPNHKYSSPNKLYEAMMIGRPIIVAKGTGIDKIVDKENIGISIDYSKEAFELAIIKLLEHKETWHYIGDNARKLYSDKFSWDIMKERLLQMYSHLHQLVKSS